VRKTAEMKRSIGITRRRDVSCSTREEMRAINVLSSGKGMRHDALHYPGEPQDVAAELVPDLNDNEPSGRANEPIATT